LASIWKQLKIVRGVSISIKQMTRHAPLAKSETSTMRVGQGVDDSQYLFQ
jgi:hypothetical protein